MKHHLLPIALLTGLSTHAAIFTNSIDADAFVRAAVPASNYGGAGALSVSGAVAVNVSGVTNGIFDSFIRFNTTSMVSNFNSLYGTNNWAINGASLQVTETGAPANNIFNRGVGGFEIRWITNDSWVEGNGMPNAPSSTGINYNSESTLLTPGMDTSLGVFTNTGTGTNVSFQLSLRPAFMADVAAGGEVSLFLTATDAGTGFTFNSRSFTTTNQRPSVVISALPRPRITAFNMKGTNFVLNATNGAVGATGVLLSTTNFAMPLSQWLPVATNIVAEDGSSSFTFTNTVNSAAGQQYFILQTH